MGRYLVTGGCGFIGSHLYERLRADGHQVRVVDDLSTGKLENLPPEADLVVGTVTDCRLMADAMAGMDGCFHLAAIASVQRSVEDWLGTHSVNLTGTIVAFEGARRHGGIPVVYCSSAAVYGDNSDVPLHENASARPLTGYGADKLGCELHGRVATLVHKVPTTGLRFFNVFGPRQDPHSPYSGVISIFVERLLKGQDLTIYGDGLQSRDFVFVSDVVDHLVAAMQRSVLEPRIFNVCTGRSSTILDLAHTLGEVMGVVPQIRLAPTRPGDIRASVGSPDHCRQTLGLSAKTTLKDGLAKTVAAVKPG